MIEGQNDQVLEELVELFKRFINNEPGYFTCPISQRFSAIDIPLRKSDLGTLTLKEILNEFLAISDQDNILLRSGKIDIGLSLQNIG